MDTFTAYLKAKAATEAGAKFKIFDWHKAAQLIKDRKPRMASAGLSGDWEYTGGEIYNSKEGALKTGYTYLESNHATPELALDRETIDCYIDSDHNPNNWDAHTFWPQSALDILNSK